MERVSVIVGFVILASLLVRTWCDRSPEPALEPHTDDACSRTAQPWTPPPREATASGNDWIDLFVIACETLTSASSDVISAVTISGRLTDGDRDRPSLVALCRHLAGEYYLTASPSIVGQILTVRFARRVGEAAQHASGHRSRFGTMPAITLLQQTHEPPLPSKSAEHQQHA